MRPRRTSYKQSSLLMVGIPKKFCECTLKDYNTFGSTDLGALKDYIRFYIENVEDTFKECHGLYMYGSNGVGKTMLASIILREAFMCRFTVRRCTFADYIAEYTRAWSCTGKDEKDAMEDNLFTYYKGVEFLVLEEVGKEIDTKIARPILEDLLRYREEKGLVTIMCSNITPEDFFERYGNSIMSLMQGNMTPIEIVGKDRREVKDHY